MFEKEINELESLESMENQDPANFMEAKTQQNDSLMD